MLTRELIRYIRRLLREQSQPLRTVDFLHVLLLMLRWRGWYLLVFLGVIGIIIGPFLFGSVDPLRRYVLAPFSILFGIFFVLLALSYPFRIYAILRRGQCCSARVTTLSQHLIASDPARMRPVTGTWTIEAPDRQIVQPFRIERAWGLRLTVGSRVWVILPASPPYVAIPLYPLRGMPAPDSGIGVSPNEYSHSGP
jgi:hypothetical protein